MANTLGVYNPTMYANEALIQLEMALGMAPRVYRELDMTPRDRGETIQIRRPGSFTAADMPISTAADVDTDTVTVTLNKWRGVVFALDDKELAFTRERIVEEHIRPAAYAIAADIDLSLCQEVIKFPHVVESSTTTGIGDLPALYQKMFDNKVPIDNNWHLMLDGERTAFYQGLSTFHQANTNATGGDTQLTGNIGNKLNFEIFSNQQVQSGAVGTELSSITALEVNAAAVKGATTVVIEDSDASVNGAVQAGDILTITGTGEVYSVAATATASTTLTVTITEGLRTALADGDAVTITQNVTTAPTQNFAFHRNSLALAMSPLSFMGDGRGAEIAVATDPITGLALRSRIWYDGKEAKNYVGIDALWGVKILDFDLGTRYQNGTDMVSN